jgi:nucleoside-diphosphate-sugar epimerase
MRHSVFITGGTGYMGRHLIPLLSERGHDVKALVREGSERKLPVGATGVIGDALKMDSYTKDVPPADTFVHLVGVPHPSPAKARQFRDIDLVSIGVAARAARDAGVQHFIYLSVAHPAPVMKAFIDVRMAGEQLVRDNVGSVTFVRPWYVLGPGHRWPYLLLPFYRICELVPSARESAARLGLVAVHQVVNALVWAVENPPPGERIIDVPGIRELGKR